AAGFRLPVIALKTVVFPAPFGPISPTICRGRTRSDTSSSARTPPKRTETPRTSRDATPSLIAGRGSSGAAADDVELIHREPAARVDPPERVQSLARRTQLPDHREAIEDVLVAPGVSVVVDLRALE